MVNATVSYSIDGCGGQFRSGIVASAPGWPVETWHVELHPEMRRPAFRAVLPLAILAAHVVVRSACQPALAILVGCDASQISNGQALDVHANQRRLFRGAAWARRCPVAVFKRSCSASTSAMGTPYLSATACADLPRLSAFRTRCILFAFLV